MTHRCGFERRRGDEGEQARDLRQRLRRHLQRLVDLGTLRRELECEPGRSSLLSREQRIDIDPVAGLGRHAARRGMRMREQAEPLELGELGTHGRGGHTDAAPLDE